MRGKLFPKKMKKKSYNCFKSNSRLIVGNAGCGNKYNLFSTCFVIFILKHLFYPFFFENEKFPKFYFLKNFISTKR